MTQRVTTNNDNCRAAASRSFNNLRLFSKERGMQYTLTGFTHDMGFRVFAFECVGDDRTRTEYRVRADLALTRKYGIRIQELPLLCRRLLERREGSDPQRTYTYAESDMCLRADASAIEAATQKKRTPRRPPSANVGTAWRGPQL